MSRLEEFSHPILLIGTNPLSNFVVADYFLQTNSDLRTILILHSEENRFQADMCKQAKNLEALLRNRWKHEHVHFPPERISLSVVIRRELQERIFNRHKNVGSLHLNYTGGTKVMDTHAYMLLKHFQKSGQSVFSYLDSNNFRLIKEAYASFNRPIDLNGFNNGTLNARVHMKTHKYIKTNAVH